METKQKGTQELNKISVILSCHPSLFYCMFISSPAPRTAPPPLFCPIYPSLRLSRLFSASDMASLLPFSHQPGTILSSSLSPFSWLPKCMSWHGGILDGGMPIDIDIGPRYGRHMALFHAIILFASVSFFPFSS